jgi:5'-3' exonuclease
VKCHLLDGTYELFRHFHAVPRARSADGAEIGAVRGLLRSLLSLLREPGVTHVAIAFDHVIESFRNELFADYKTGEGVDPALLAQFEPAEDACRALGFLTWPMVEFEADDAIATAAKRLADDERVEQVVILSPDKDLAQCVRGTRVVCFDRMRKKALDEAGVLAKFGVAPTAVPDWLALVGDAADGIPGLPGWGEKSSAAVLGAYGTLEAIPDDPQSWTVTLRGAARLAATLRERREDALLYRMLATLRTDVPIEISPEVLCWRGPDAEALAETAETLREPRLLERALALTAEQGASVTDCPG